MTPKAELLNQAARAYNAFEQAIHGLTEDHLTEVRLARGEKPTAGGVSYDDVDAWNARFVAATRDRSLDEILLELDRSHESFMHLAAAVPDERVRPGTTAYRIIDACTAHHYTEHGDQIRAWRAQRDL
jgi:hypothetical protein